MNVPLNDATFILAWCENVLDPTSEENALALGETLRLYNEGLLILFQCLITFSLSGNVAVEKLIFEVWKFTR